MEGPSLFLAAEQLKPFVGKRILSLSGNTKQDKEKLAGKRILSIFSYGKYLFFQFDSFALRVHFMLFGSFEATVDGIKVTGDYPRKQRESRLSLYMKNGRIELYSCSIRLIDQINAKEDCDFTKDVMSDEWDEKKALLKLKNFSESEISDVLLDQEIFMGVGNIIRNEALHLAKISPVEKVGSISQAKLKKIISLVRSYVFQFYKWRKNFELKKHYRVYRQSKCKDCESPIIRKKTGVRNRMSFICPQCQKS